ncbi:protein cordon-bleu isoform X3 [Sceloporus undulatus]|uniref:protein cordon-bleu isoform X3 n=1 Tax=Sceloporus undulatus TaxID=8520 RepID=UPI001C4AA22D|nr:protein cordon-bleu isoform X3 [Sceloporus undulatus]
MEAEGLLPRGRRRMKARAPPPPNHPPAPCKVNNEHSSATDLETLSVNMKQNLISRTVDFTIVFPDGEEQKDNVPGSKAVMDLLVDLCSRHHLNPAHHILELQSWGTQHPLNYKPNTMIGILDVQKIVLKEKIPEEKTKQPPSKIPEKTVRLVVNYLKTQKAVVRVSPEVPLYCIIPAICEKCDFSQEHLVLLRDTFTGEELELTQSLNELGIKELYAWDRKRVLPSRAQSEPSLNYREARNFSSTCEATEKGKMKFLGFFKTNKRNNKSVTTVPHSSSVNPCSVLSGPSLSLGNISGMTGSSEIKKRRAPPPPAILSHLLNVETNGEENILSQKKKRRAPPPPIPTMPNRMEEIGDKRKSTVGNGWHVPQKPPIGNTRGPPQLVIPPPPPYPPPDRDTMESSVHYSEAEVSDPTKLVPKRNLQVLHDIYNMDNIILELSEIEESISVTSCFASEDTTEDSGVMSSPSDKLSLNSQNDSMSSRSKSVDAQEGLVEMVPMALEEDCSTEVLSFNSDESRNIYQRNRDSTKIMEAKIEDSDIFIAAQLQDTLAALDKDLAAMEDMNENSENGSLSSAPTPFPQTAEATLDVSLPVPVTIIDHVPDIDIKIQRSSEEEKCLFSKRGINEKIPVQPICLGEQINENNNSGSFTEGYVDYVSPCLCENLLSQQFLKEKVRHQSKEEQTYESDTYVSSYKKKKKDAYHDIHSEESKAKVFASSLEFMNKVYEQRLKKEVKHLKKENKEELPSKLKTELEFRHRSEKNLSKKEGSPLPHLVHQQVPQCHRVHNRVTNYDPKNGLTTFKIVPPKPAVKYFDRDTSLFTGVIKIDELGNLVTPNSGGIGKITGNKNSSETEDRAKAYWKSNSVEKQLEESPVGHSTKPVVITCSKPFSKISDINPEKGIKPETEKVSSKNIIVAKYYPVETQSEKTEETYSSIFSCRKSISNMVPLGVHYRIRNNTTNSKSMDQTKSSDCYSAPVTTILSKNSSTTEKEPIPGSVQNVIIREIPLILNQKKGQNDQASSTFFLRSSEVPSSSITFIPFVKSTMEHPFNSGSSASLSTLTVNHMFSKKDEKHGDACLKNEPESTINDDNLYNVFGPKKKFKPVIQKPLPKDKSLHRTLMEAIQTAGGREKLRKISHGIGSGTQKKPSFTEPENEHSALLAAIRGHNGSSGLRKICSFASEELQHFKNAEIALQNKNTTRTEQQCDQLLLPPPQPPSQLTKKIPRSFTNKITKNTENPRQALMEAIRSGAGAAHLRKVPLLV